MLLSEPTTKKTARAKGKTWRQEILDICTTLDGEFAEGCATAWPTSWMISGEYRGWKGDLRDLSSPHEDRCLLQPSVSRQLLHDEPSDIGACYFPAVDAGEIHHGFETSASWIVGEHGGANDDPIE